MSKIISAVKGMSSSGRRILLSVGAVGVVAAAVVMSTGAFFSDTETSTGNVFTAGAVDLQIDSQTHYNKMICVPNTQTEQAGDYYWQPEEGFVPGPAQFPTAGTPCTGTWDLKNLTVEKLFDFQDLKPGDFGENTISMHVFSNDAWACLETSNVTEGEGDPAKTEPEELVDPAAVLPDNGELLSAMQFFAWADDGDNIYEPVGEPGEVAYYQAPVSGDTVIQNNKWAIADSQNGSPIVGGQTKYIGVAWCFGNMTVNPDGSIACDGSEVGNQSQTDTASFDVTFSVEQSRNNPNFLCNPATTGTITVHKVIEGGQDISVNSFAPYKVDGATVTLDTLVEVLPGQHTVTETSNPNYNAAFSGDCNESGIVNVVAGQNYTCTITNSFGSGRITVNKVVVNTGGGTLQNQDFSFSVNGATSTPFEADGSNAISVPIGDHTIVESPSPVGYAVTYSNNLNANANCDNLPVANGETTAVCTITNTFVVPTGTLTVHKVMVNNNGGNNVASDFQLTVNGNNVANGGANALAPGGYTVSEFGVGGYVASFSGDCDANGQVTLGSGDNKTCTITNDDLPGSIQLTKVVVNTNQGTATPASFTLRVDGFVVPSGNSIAVTANSPHAINEDAKAGYSFVSITGDALCPAVLGGTATLNEGQNISCTITNHDNLPQ